MDSIDFGLGNGRAYLKIDARNGTFKVRDFNGSDVSFSAATFAIDLPSLKAGWVGFPPGQGPQFVEGLSNPKPPPIGAAEFGKGVRFNIYGEDTVDALGEALGLRDVTSTAFVVRKAVAALYQQYQRECDEHPGQIPLVEVNAFETVEMKNGVACAPIFKIVGWVDRCSQLIEAAGEMLADATGSTSAVPADLDDEIPF